MKDVGNETGFNLQTRYLVDILLFLYDALITLYVMSFSLVSLQLKWPKTSWGPRTQSKDLRFDDLIVFNQLCFFYLDFVSRPFTNHRTAGEEGGHFLTSSLLFPIAS